MIGTAMKIKNHAPNNLMSKQIILIICIQDKLNINIKGKISR